MNLTSTFNSVARVARNIRTLATRELSINKPTAARKRSLPYTQKAVGNTKLDIQFFKAAEALARATEPKNYAIQLVLEEAKRDALLTSQINNRKQQSFSIPFTLKKPNGDIDKEQTALLKKMPLYRFLNHAGLDSIYHGYSHVELKYATTVTGTSLLIGETIPRTNIVPQTGYFYPDYANDQGKISYREMPEFGTWILEYISQDGALLNKAVPHVIFKRFAQSCWAELCEIYGIPPRWMKTDTSDSEMMDKAEQMMKDMGSAAWAVIDSTEELGFAEGVTTTGDVYSNLISLSSNELCLLIVGVVMGQDTKNGTRSKDESSQELLWYLVQSDLAMLEEYWNTINIPALQKHGILKGDLTFAFDEAEDLNKLWGMVVAAWDKFKIPADWIKEKFGIPVEEMEEPEEVEDEQEPEDPDPDKPVDPKKKKKAKKAPKTEAEKLAAGLDFFLNASATKVEAEMKQRAKLCCGGHPINLSLPASDFDGDALIKRVWDAEGDLSFDIAQFYYTVTILTGGLKKGWKADKANLAVDIGFTYGKDDPALLTAYELNLVKFSAAKTLAQAQKLNELFRRSKDFETFYINAKLIVDVFNKTWLEAEYTTAMLVAESSATYNRLMNNSELFPYWEYKTVGDDRVRPEHRELDGLILPFNDPRWSKLFPPLGWMCRCYIVARTRDEVKGIDFDAMRARADTWLKGTEFKKSEATGWGVNRAETGEVFSANQSYINKLEGKAAKILDELQAKDYNLKSYSQAKKVATEELPVYTDTAAKFLAENPVIRDYHNRPITLDPKSFKKHTSGSREYRVPYLDALKQTLSNPHEVWVGGKNSSQIISIRYYTNETLVTVTEIVDGTVHDVVTWFPLKEKASVINKYRRGLLLFSKAAK